MPEASTSQEAKIRFAVQLFSPVTYHAMNISRGGREDGEAIIGQGEATSRTFQSSVSSASAQPRLPG